MFNLHWESLEPMEVVNNQHQVISVFKSREEALLRNCPGKITAVINTTKW